MLTAYIAMGANLPRPAGPPDATLAAAAARVNGELGRLVARSSLYSTEPVGLADQPRFTNAVVALETSLAPRTLLNALLDLERAFGRNRAESLPNGPRTLDLDILLMGDLRISEPGLELPHPRLADRAFVLVPLCEIAPDAVDPVQHRTITQLLDALPGNDLRSVLPVDSPHWSPHPPAARADLS